MKIHADVGEEIYMKQPEGFTIKWEDDQVCRLRKTLYGLKNLSQCRQNEVIEKLVLTIVYIM